MFTLLKVCVEYDLDLNFRVLCEQSDDFDLSKSSFKVELLK